MDRRVRGRERGRMRQRTSKCDIWRGRSRKRSGREDERGGRRGGDTEVPGGKESGINSVGE